MARLPVVRCGGWSFVALLVVSLALSARAAGAQGPTEVYSLSGASTLAAGIGPRETVFQVQSGEGARFATPSRGQYMWVAIESQGTHEMLRCTVRVNDTISGCARGQQATVAATFPRGAIVYNPPPDAAARQSSTAASVAARLTRGPLTLSGPPPQLRLRPSDGAADALEIGRDSAGVVSIGAGERGLTFGPDRLWLNGVINASNRDGMQLRERGDQAGFVGIGSFVGTQSAPGEESSELVNIIAPTDSSNYFNPVVNFSKTDGQEITKLYEIGAEPIAPPAFTGRQFYIWDIVDGVDLLHISSATPRIWQVGAGLGWRLQGGRYEERPTTGLEGGTLFYFWDAPVANPGAEISSGGGSNPVLGWFDGRAWRVVGASATGHRTETVAIVPASCRNGEARTDLSSGPKAPRPTCVVESDAVFGVLRFPDRDGSYDVFGQLRLPDDWAGAFDVTGQYRGQGTRGAVLWQLSTGCVSDGEASGRRTNHLEEIVDEQKTTAHAANDFSRRNIVTAGCAPGELLHWRLRRTRDHDGDTTTGAVDLISLTFTLRRTL